MARLHAVVVSISLWMARLGGLMLVAASAMISFEIVARKLLVIPFSVGTELSSYALAAAASWSFSYALLNRAHVRIDVLRNWVGPKARLALDVLALWALAATAIVLAVYCWDTVHTSWELNARENTSFGTPLVIPQGLWFVGLAWFALVCTEQLSLTMLALARRNYDAAAAIVAPPNLDDEVEEALDATDARAATLK
jgi:TRAP-type C4-dicarboxylate transport system permease small subunit